MVIEVKRRRFLGGFNDEELAEFLGLPEETQARMIRAWEPDETDFEVPEPERFNPAKLPELPEPIEDFDTQFLSPDVSIVRKKEPDLLESLFPEKPEEGPKLPELVKLAKTDPDEFMRDLMQRGTQQDREDILREMGIQEQDIARIFTEQQRLQDLVKAAKAVFPEFTLDELAKYVEQDWELFIKDIRRGGRTREKQVLLREMGLS